MGIKVGLLGQGRQGTTLLESLQSTAGVELLGVADMVVDREVEERLRGGVSLS